MGPPAAIEYAVEPVAEEIINPSPLYSLTFSLLISIFRFLVSMLGVI